VVLATGGSSELLQAACEALKNLCDGHDGCKAQVRTANSVCSHVFDAYAKRAALLVLAP
jgi:hypothetical protein